MTRPLLAALAALTLLPSLAAAQALPEGGKTPRPLRVLLAAAGPTRDFYFLRALLLREAEQGKFVVSVYLQSALTPDCDVGVPPPRWLRAWPEPLTGRDRPTLADFDAIVALDLDWRRVPRRGQELLEEWVHTRGGLILTAGPVHSRHLARLPGKELSPVQALCPVEPGDNRHDVIHVHHDPVRPWALKFAPEADLLPFLKLEDGTEGSVASWNRFFWGQPRRPEAPNAVPLRGFHSYQAVESVRPGAAVLAVHDAPHLRRRDGKGELPFLVSGRHGAGRVVYLGSAEVWRLRHYSDDGHARFVLGLLRYAAAPVPSTSLLVAGERYTVGDEVRVEARLLGKDGKPVVEGRPMARIVAPAGEKGAGSLSLEPVQGRPGWFRGALRTTGAGEYRLALDAPGGETVAARFLVQALPVLTPGEETAQRQRELAQRFEKWAQGLREAAGRGQDRAPKALEKAAQYGSALTSADERSVRSRLAALAELLRTDELKRAVQAREAVARSKRIVEDLQALTLPRDDPHAAELAAILAGQREQTERLLRAQQRLEGALLEDLLGQPGAKGKDKPPR